MKNRTAPEYMCSEGGSGEWGLSEISLQFRVFWHCSFGFGLSGKQPLLFQPGRAAGRKADNAEGSFGANHTDGGSVKTVLDDVDDLSRCIFRMTGNDVVTHTAITSPKLIPAFSA